MIDEIKKEWASLIDEIEESGDIKIFLIAMLIAVITFPFLLLYWCLIKPMFKGCLMLVEAKKLGIKASFMKQLYPDRYRKERKGSKIKEKENTLIPAGKWKRFELIKDWPDTYVADGIAIYGAEGRTLLFLDEHVEEYTVPEGVENIYHGCFANCDVLRRITLPSTLKRIGKRAFMNCVSLTEVRVPNSVYIFDEEVFLNCSSLETVVLPTQMATIPHRTFCNCGNLRYIKLPSELQSIDSEAFRRCYSLEHVEPNEKLERIGEKAFEDCFSLKEFIMPESVQSCTEGMFNGCHSLQHIHFSSQIKDFGGSCCRDCWSIKQISMPVDEKMKSWVKEHWQKYSGEVDMSISENPVPESLFWTMGDTLYFGVPRLTNVCLMFCFSKESTITVPSFVTNVKRDAFTSCKNLTTLRLSPYIKMSSDPWEQNNISYDFIYEYWPQVKTVFFDESLKNSKYAFCITL